MAPKRRMEAEAAAESTIKFEPMPEYEVAKIPVKKRGKHQSSHPNYSQGVFVATASRNRDRSKKLTEMERVYIVADLKPYLNIEQRVIRLPGDVAERIAAEHGVAKGTVCRYYAKLRDNNGNIEATAKVNREACHKNALKYSEDEINARIQAVPLESRTSLRALAAATGLSRTTLFRHTQRNKMSPHVFSSK
jgi:hypothetical protein